MLQTTWNHLYSHPLALGKIKSIPEDFIVHEHLAFELSDEGEHYYLKIEKIQLNTLEIVDILSRTFKLHPKNIGYAGMKDKQAKTTQWFSLHLPKKIPVDIHQLCHPQIKIISTQWHHKKLKIGNIARNDFIITIRECQNINDLIKKIDMINNGVPNYYGTQRFGTDFNNIIQAYAMMEGKKISNKKKRGIYLSAIRSYLFNCFLSHRIEQYKTTYLTGDVALLSGSNSYFTIEKWDETLLTRLKDRDIMLSAPLLGKGQLSSLHDALLLENEFIEQHQKEMQLLSDFDITLARRSCLFFPKDFTYQIDKKSAQIILQFSLNKGCYATSLLKELILLE